MDVAFEGFTWPERFLVVGIDRDYAGIGARLVWRGAAGRRAPGSGDASHGQLQG